MKTSRKAKLKIVNSKRLDSKTCEKTLIIKDLTIGAKLILLNSNCLKKAA